MNPADTETRHIRARGRVQGVGYRASCVDLAQQLGITGWVRNRADGSVEAVLQGPADKVAAMCRWLREDVPGARVDRLDEAPLPEAERYARFELRRTE